MRIYMFPRLTSMVKQSSLNNNSAITEENTDFVDSVQQSANVLSWKKVVDQLT